MGGARNGAPAGNLREPRRSTRAARVVGCPEAPQPKPGLCSPLGMRCLCGVTPSWMGPPGSDTPAPPQTARAPGVLTTRHVHRLPRTPVQGRRVARLTITNVMLRTETRVLSSPARQPPPQEQSPGFRASRVSRCPRLIPISEQKHHGNLPDKHSAITRALTVRSTSKPFFQMLCQQNKCLRHWR